MNKEQVQQGRDTLIKTLNWTAESILEFAKMTCNNDIRKQIKEGLLIDLSQIKVDVDSLLSIVDGMTDANSD